jgi:hypothetical protein
MSPAMLEAFSGAVRATLVGSVIPTAERSSYASLSALKPKAPFPVRIYWSTVGPSTPVLPFYHN